jgi:catechol-2,3-dioxygenase
MKIHELGHVVLYVSSLEKSLHFYKDILGFREVYHSDSIALFSSGRSHHELLLIQVGGDAKDITFPTPGLYHIGLKIGDSHEELVAAYKELQSSNVRIVGATDHTVTHSLYILDPDNNEIELYVDVTNTWKDDPLAILRPPRPLRLE